MSSSIKQEFTSLRSCLKKNDTAHINTNDVECISYEDENTGSVSELTSYLHESVRNIFQEMDSRINNAINKSVTQSTC